MTNKTNNHDSSHDGKHDAKASATQPIRVQETASAQAANGQDRMATQPIAGIQPRPITPNVTGNGNGDSAREAPRTGVRPVTARLGEGFVREHPGVDTSAISFQPSASGASNGNTNGNGNANGQKAQVSRGVTQQTTGVLRDTDLHELRLRLKREGLTPVHTSARRTHKRPLPYFLMRHRTWRGHSRVGHVRSQAANRRYGGGGAFAIAARVFLIVSILFGVLGGVGLGGAVAGGLWYIQNKLPPVIDDPVTGQKAIHGIDVQTTKIYDRNGIPLFDIVDEDTGRRHYVKLEDISPFVISATIAAEDASFFSNPGVDPVSIARAFKINLGGEGQSGASTITQQLMREVNLPKDERYEQSVSRKIREMIQAVRFTRVYSKSYILELYLNENPYGHRAYGVDAAALIYFGKSAKDLTLPESALVAGLPQAPTDYDPFVNPDLAKRRQAIVLDLMVKQNMITQDQADRAKADVLILRPYNPVLRAPHFVYYVKSYLERLYGPEANTAGLIVTTTLDLRVQEAAEKVARDRIDELRRQHATNASIVIMKPGTGEILAMVGSVDYNDTSIDGQVNVATRERQPGSSFKPITYATAFKKGWTPGTVVLDTLTAFPNGNQKPYTPHNYDGRDHGWVTVREALGNSYNIPAVKALQFAGVQDVIDTAHDMGIHGLNRGLGWYGLSLTLGGGEVTLLDMTNAYSTFANGGVEVDADPILRIEDPQGRIIECNGIYKYKDISGGQKCSAVQQKPFADGNGLVLDPRFAYMTTSILSDNHARSSAFGVNNPLHMSFPAAAKTGTTDDNRDSWTMGYTPNLAIGVWVGNSNNAEMLKVTGAIGAAVIWHNMMETFYGNKAFVNLVRDSDGNVQTDFEQPAGLIKDTACSQKGDIYDLFLADKPPTGCTTYRDKNPQLHSAPSDAKPTPSVKTRPTPLPGILPPLNP